MFETNGYLGFTFAGRHSSEFGLLVVSDGSRYHQNSYNQFSDSTKTVPGKNGGYYFKTQLSQREFNISCVFDNITSHTMHKIQQWLYPDIVGWLIFDEQPYKRYLVKLSSVPTFEFIPFDEFKSAEGYTFQKEILKGEVNFSFYMLQEYGIYNPNYNLPTISKKELISQQALDSGLIPKKYVRKNIYLPHEKIDIIEKDTDIFSLYNAGNGVAKANFYFTIDQFNTPLEIKNFDDGVIYRITNPINTFSKKYTSNIVENITSYRIEILSNKQEIYATGLNSSGEEITDKVNIGAHYNHHFPKVYHIKPTETCIFSQVVNEGGVQEPLLYTFSYAEDNFNPSDSGKNEVHTFEEFKEYWNDYTIVTVANTFIVNNIISPAVIFIEYPENYLESNEKILYQDLGYLIYPNKYNTNYQLKDFVAEYDHTYI